MARHKWTKAELDIVKNYRTQSALEIKTYWFYLNPDITVKAIQRQKDFLRGSHYDYARPWTDEDIQYLREHINEKNAVLYPLLQRRPDDLDRMKHRIRHNNGPARPNVKPSAEQVVSIVNTGTNEVTDYLVHDSVFDITTDTPGVIDHNMIEIADQLFNTVRNFDPAMIDTLRNSKPFTSQRMLIAMYDYLNARKTTDVPISHPSRKLLRYLRENVEGRLRIIRKLAPNKSAAVSTFLNNTIKMICGFAPTSWRNLQVHNEVEELRCLAMAILDYCQDKNIERPGN